MSQDNRFIEVEHKFVVSDEFDVAGFRASALAMAPERTGEVEVKDTYFVVSGHPELMFRHRIDDERQELTVKSRGGDTESRLEVNLRLDPAAGDQRASAAAFLAPFGVRWQGTLHKQVQVFYFADCEVVYYHAQVGGRSVRCVEFEAVDHSGDVEAARATLVRYERELGFAERERTRTSLFDLLLAPLMNAL